MLPVCMGMRVEFVPVDVAVNSNLTGEGGGTPKMLPPPMPQPLVGHIVYAMVDMVVYTPLEVRK